MQRAGMKYPEIPDVSDKMGHVENRVVLAELVEVQSCEVRPVN